MLANCRVVQTLYNATPHILFVCMIGAFWPHKSFCLTIYSHLTTLECVNLRGGVHFMLASGIVTGALIWYCPVTTIRTADTSILMSSVLSHNHQNTSATENIVDSVLIMTSAKKNCVVTRYIFTCAQVRPMHTPYFILRQLAPCIQLSALSALRFRLPPYPRPVHIHISPLARLTPTRPHFSLLFVQLALVTGLGRYTRPAPQSLTLYHSHPLTP